jgi:hypothetical protein
MFARQREGGAYHTEVDGTRRGGRERLSRLRILLCHALHHHIPTPATIAKGNDLVPAWSTIVFFSSGKHMRQPLFPGRMYPSVLQHHFEPSAWCVALCRHLIHTATKRLSVKFCPRIRFRVRSNSPMSLWHCLPLGLWIIYFRVLSHT